jgi:chitinase
MVRPEGPSMAQRMRRFGVLLALSVGLGAAVAGAAVVRAGSGASAVKHRTRTTHHATTPKLVFLFGRKGTIDHSAREAAGAAVAFRFRDQTPGVAATVSVYVRSGGTAKQIVAGLYSGTGSHPGSRLASASGSIGHSGRWLTLSLPSSTIAKGRTYWIALLGQHGTLELAAEGQTGCRSVTERGAALASLPRAWKPGKAAATCVSAYVSGSPKSTPPNSPPSNTSLPQISGAADVGTMLTASSGAWTGSPTSYTYQWRDCGSSTGCANITGATGSSYTVQSSDEGHTLDVVVTATNAYGSTNANSARTQIVPGSGTGPGTGQSVAFWLAWSGSIQESQIPWNAVTQVDLFSLTTTTDTSGCSSNCTSLNTSQNGISRMNLSSWVSTIHNNGKLAIISIGGSTDQDWANACAPANLPGFTSKLVNYMVSNGFDGVDLDIESLSGSGSQLSLWTACEQSIAQAAHSATTQAGAIPLVSTDVDQSWMDSAVSKFEQWPDQFNLMYYGYPTGSYSCANSCSQVNTLVQGLHNTGDVPYNRMMLGMSPGGSQDQCCYSKLAATTGSVATGGSVTSIALASQLSAALPAGNVVLATKENPPSHYEIFTTSGAAKGATAIPITGEVSGSGAYTFPSGSQIQSDYAGPWDCGNFAAYATATGLGGVMIWDLQEEAAEHNGQFPCFAQVAPYVGSS